VPHEQRTLRVDQPETSQQDRVKAETSKRILGLSTLQEDGLLQEQQVDVQAKDEKLDKIGQDSLPIIPLVKKDFDAACQVTAVDHLVEQMTASLDTQGVPKELRMTVVAEAFMKVRQIDALGFTLLSEDELASAPNLLKSDSKPSHPSEVVPEILATFKHRIGRGFLRRHIRFAAPNLYYRLSIWLKDKENELPDELSPNSYDPELFVNPLTATKSFVNQRSKLRKSAHKQAL